MISPENINLVEINPFVPNAPFLYPLKTSENRKVFWCFQRVEKGCIGNEWVKFKNLINLKLNFLIYFILYFISYIFHSCKKLWVQYRLIKA